MPRLLELCSGTGSVGRAFAAQGWEVVSVDNNPKAHPTICCCLLELTAEQCLAHGPVDFVWASPPCTHYSRTRTPGGPRDLEGSDKLARKCLDLAAELGAPFIMENPWTGLLRHRDVVAGIFWRARLS
jgi:site-specific DNA-cytosine methylase